MIKYKEFTAWYCKLVESFKFEVLKTGKTPLKNLNEEKYIQSEKKEFEAFERVIILLL